MRSGGIAVFAGLAGLAGCNQIFGLDAVILVDAGPDSIPVDAEPPTVSLTTMTPTLAATGQPTAAVEYHPLSPAPRIEYGEIGGTLTEHPYEDGIIHIPYDYSGRATDWRLVYTPQGSVPHEVQWHPPADGGFLTELVGADRPAVPTGAKFALTPGDGSGGVFTGSFTKPRVYTTNVWSETRQPAVAGTTVAVDYTGTGTVSHLGPLSAVGPTDDIMLVDFAVAPDTNNGCQASKGAAPFQVTVAANTTAVDTMPPPWTFSALKTYALTASTAPSTSLQAKYQVSSSDVQYFKVFGLVPNDAIPLFQGHTELGIPLPLPLGPDLVECNLALTANSPHPITINLPDFDAPNDSAMLGAGTVQFALNRSPAMAPAVTIGFAATVVADTSVTNYAPQFAAPLAFMPTIDGLDVTVPAQFAPSTPVTLTGTTSPATLAFTTIPDGLTADFYEATLYQIQTPQTSPTRVPVREFTFRASPLQFDRDLLVPGQLYMFEVRGISGASNADKGDFRAWTANQSISRTFTQTFQR